MYAQLIGSKHNPASDTVVAQIKGNCNDARLYCLYVRGLTCCVLTCETVLDNNMARTLYMYTGTRPFKLYTYSLFLFRHKQTSFQKHSVNPIYFQHGKVQRLILKIDAGFLYQRSMLQNRCEILTSDGIL